MRTLVALILLAGCSSDAQSPAGAAGGAGGTPNPQPMTTAFRRAGLEVPPGQDSRTRSDIEVLFDALPEPIDLELDLDNRQVYWTDRGDNTVNRAPMDPSTGATATTRTDREVLVRGLGEAIGIALDLEHDAMYFTGLDGRLGASKLDGSGAMFLLRNVGLLTGIAHAVLPP